MITKENSNEFSQRVKLGINGAVRRLWMLMLGLKKYKLTTEDMKSTFLIERFAIECCKIKTGVVTLANLDGHKQP